MTIDEICESFGTGISSIDSLVDDLSIYDYRSLSQQERDDVVLNILNKIQNDTKVVGTPCRKKVWHDGWNENLKMLQNNLSYNSLMPNFITNDHIVRFKKDFIYAKSAQFLRDYSQLFKRWLFSTFLNEGDTIYEFGCGSGYNLLTINELYPSNTLVGFDFAQSSLSLIERIKRDITSHISGKYFDMISPDYSVRLEDNSVVLTLDSIEQLSNNYYEFIKYLIQQNPKLCIHVEPIVELYDSSNLSDWLAIQFHNKRKYPTGFLPYLEKLDTEGKIELVKYKRIFFGQIYTEGFSYIIWKPRNS